MRLPPVDLEFLACLISGLFWSDVIARIPSPCWTSTSDALGWSWIFHFACRGLCLGIGRFNPPPCSNLDFNLRGFSGRRT